MIREGSIPGWEQAISLQAADQGSELPGGDHHQVIDDSEPVPGRMLQRWNGRTVPRLPRRWGRRSGGNERGCRCLTGTPGILRGSGVPRGERPGPSRLCACGDSLRDRLIVETFLLAGLRVSELCSIYVQECWT
jgi:hypothetical protein